MIAIYGKYVSTRSSDTIRTLSFDEEQIDLSYIACRNKQSFEYKRAENNYTKISIRNYLPFNINIRRTANILAKTIRSQNMQRGFLSLRYLKKLNNSVY